MPRSPTTAAERIAPDGIEAPVLRKIRATHVENLHDSLTNTRHDGSITSALLHQVRDPGISAEQRGIYMLLYEFKEGGT
jgi:hypothetical protein